MPDPFGLSEGVKTLSGSLDSTREATKGLSKSIENIQHDGIDVAQKQAQDRIRARREAEKHIIAEDAIMAQKQATAAFFRQRNYAKRMSV
jgi:hypothetical protein